jgi:DNA adenine methylase
MIGGQNMNKPKPFVKWVGGKRQIIDKIKEYAPKEYNCYYEPFVGGGAVLFELAPKNAVINDFNEELINVYKVITNEEKYKKMMKILKLYEKKNSEEFYYYIRNQDRQKASISRMKDYTRAARTLYLNKACFNGLYRVNSNNEFNVPYNKSAKIKTYDENNLKMVHEYLINNDIKILTGDFEEAVKEARKGDFVYFDPPYDTLNDSFTSYTKNGFDKNEQLRLFETYKMLDKKGVNVMLSNHNTPFINDLYKDYKIIVVNAKRSVNSNGKKRGNVEETIIINY